MAPPRKYSDELRRRAVRRYRDSAPRPSIRSLASDLGVHPEALRTWVRQDEADRAQRHVPYGPVRERPDTVDPPAAPAEADVEIRRLRAENVALRCDNDFLLAACAFFARRFDPTVTRS